MSRSREVQRKQRSALRSKAVVDSSSLASASPGQAVESEETRLHQPACLGESVQASHLQVKKKVQALTGLTIIGSEAGCGKTAAMAGLARALRDQGVNLRAIKPLSIGPGDKLDRELSFISMVTGTPRNYGAVSVVDRDMGDVYWSEALSLALSGGQFTMVETCGGSVTPICFETASPSVRWRDSRDLALELGFPCLVVARHNQDAIEKLILTHSYLSAAGLQVSGLLTVETVAGEGNVLESRLTRSQLELLLASRINAPYLGAIKFSPSISVTRVNQGNLVKVLESGVDLLAFRRALNLPLSL